MTIKNEGESREFVEGHLWETIVVHIINKQWGMILKLAKDHNSPEFGYKVAKFLLDEERAGRLQVVDEVYDLFMRLCDEVVNPMPPISSEIMEQIYQEYGNMPEAELDRITSFGA